MSRPITTTVTIIAGVANGIALSQSLGAAGPLAFNGSLVTNGVAVFDAPRRVAIYSSGNDTSLTWSVTGTLRPEMSSIIITETLAGGNATAVQTVNDFATVTSITGNQATANTVYAGTNGVASGPWVVQSGFFNEQMISMAAYVLSGTPTYQVDYTLDDVFGGAWTTPQTTYPRPFGVANMWGLTATKDGSIQLPCRATRLTISGGYGSVQLIQIPQGI